MFPQPALSPTLINRVASIRVTNEPMGQIEGYIAIWGSPDKRDSYNTFFDRARPPDMALEFAPWPLAYEHGQDGALRKEVVGAVTRIWFDEIGIAFSGVLNRASRWFHKILDDIRKKKLATSSSTAGHIADFDNEGRFVRWWLTELSLTETPAESNMPIVRLVRNGDRAPQLYIAPRTEAEGGQAVHDRRAGGEPNNSGVIMPPKLSDAQLRALADILAPGADASLQSVLPALVDEYGLDAVLQQLQQLQQPPPSAGGTGGSTMMSNPAAEQRDGFGAAATGGQPAAPGAQGQPAAPGTNPGAQGQPNPQATFTPQDFLSQLMQLMQSQQVQSNQLSAQNRSGGGRSLGMDLIRAMQSAPPTQTRQNDGDVEQFDFERGQRNGSPLTYDDVRRTSGGRGRGAQSYNPIPGRGQNGGNGDDGNQRNRQNYQLDVQVMSKFQPMSSADMAMGYMLMESGIEKRLRGQIQPVSNEYLRAMSMKAAADIAKGSPAAIDFAVRSKFPFRSQDEVMSSDPTWAIRAGEIMTGASGQGGEWIYDLQGTTLWLDVRNDTPFYAEMLKRGMDEQELPTGFDNETIPIEGSDPTWYVAAGSSNIDSAGIPIPTFNTSKFGTGQKAVTVAKLSVAMDFRKELEEGSIINIAQEANRKIRVTAAEQIDYIALNGDTVLTANTNMNLIDNTPAASPAQPAYTLLDGVLKLPIITNTSNRRLNGGLSFSEVDFLATLQLMPAKFRTNRAKLLFVLDSDTGLAASNITILKSKESYTKATLEEGMVTSMFRIDVQETAWMYAANSSGKIPAAGGTLGRLLLVRPDQWASRWKRRLQTEVTYYPYPDVTQVVAHMRWGMAYRDIEAAAVTVGISTALS